MKDSKTSLITVAEAEKIINNELRNYGSETTSINHSLGRVLSKSIAADRDFPPFDRVTMDGIAIRFSSFLRGNRQFKIQSIQSAGEKQQNLLLENECIEVMTGTVLPNNTDTVVRYEDLEIINSVAEIKSEIKEKQNVHFQAEDRTKGEIILPINTRIRPTEIAIAATVGATDISVKKQPKVAIITSGDELVPIDKTPELHQIRSSNVYAISSLLNKYGVESSKIHTPDSLDQTLFNIQNALENNDVLILSGGVSMGKKDLIPVALEKLGVEKLFHKIAQTPGKPFWFGKKEEKLIFALPGNPVSTYLCMVRYVIPWLKLALNISQEKEYAVLAEDFSIKNPHTYFLQVKLRNENAQIKAYPIKGNGSGDFANLVDSNAFLEIPFSEKAEFKKGDILRAWRF